MQKAIQRKIDYINMLKQLAYQANLADTEQAQPWQKPIEAVDHCQTILNAAKLILTDDQYQWFLDTLDDIDAPFPG